MKILNSKPITSFGGLNFVLKEFDGLGISKLLDGNLPELCPQSLYSWKDIFYSFWSLFFCGGDCAEDLSGNFKTSLNPGPFMRVPSPDSLLKRMKELSEPKQSFETPRGNVFHEFGINNRLTRLNLELINKLGIIEKNHLTLDYDNTLIFTRKADSKKTYKSNRGYAPGVATIGSTVVYVENRNGNSDAQTLQHETLERIFNSLTASGIKIDKFRADSASYQLRTISVISKNTNKLYVRARKDSAVMGAIALIDNWEETEEGNEKVYYGSTEFTPFEARAKRNKLEHLLKPYRLVVKKTEREDGQIDLFTGEAFEYSAIITNDYEMADEKIVHFYNQRGAAEKEFDILKNDFGWGKLPFSKLEHNTVYMILSAMCRNLYSYIIRLFSKKMPNLSPQHRIKKFIFRFICIPAKWIRTGREIKLRVYGNIYFKT